MGHFGYLVNQFHSRKIINATMNLVDQFENRMRFLVDI